MRLTGLMRRGGNYAYVSARVRAKRAKLLPAETYPKLLARDVHEIARTLQEGEYKDEVDELAGRFRGAELIERATRLNLGRTYSDLLRWSEGELRTMIALYLARYDVYNVKTVLRGKFARLAPERIVSELVPAGSLPLTKLEALARLETFEDAARGLADTPFGKVVEEALGGRMPSTLLEVENALDREYYRVLLDGVLPNTRPKQAFRDFLEREIDVVNLRTVLRLRGEDVPDLGPYWVDGGARLRLEHGQRLLRARKEDVVAELSSLPYWEEIAAGVQQTLDTGALNPALSALDRSHLKSADFFGHWYPLSVLPVIDYVLRKRVEVDNLRILAYGKETGLREAVLEGLIVA